MKVKIISGGNQHIPFCGVVPNDGTVLEMKWCVYPHMVEGRIETIGEYILGTQRGGSYGIKSGEPIKTLSFPFEVFRPNDETIQLGRLQLDGVGGFSGVPVKSYRSDDKSLPKLGERLMIYPAPYYGVWESPTVEVVET